ncbi:MAG TPA: Zn-ribbon domain-containing OB-fold protein, partial [Candidatus Udaeobacter sp.]|nr:Zn-ribbon domain-containing OB-fold protein [Candidatus Udaeobacter sp.]
MKNAGKTPPQKMALRAWPGEIPLTSLYTAGTGGQIFFHALKAQGKLIGTQCRSCEQVYVPARSFCERCFAELNEQVEVKRTGRLVSYTVCYIDRDGARLRSPVALGLVQLEGATTVIVHRLLDARDPTEVKIGCRVEAVIKPKAKRVGSILDIEGFRVI